LNVRGVAVFFLGVLTQVDLGGNQIGVEGAKVIFESIRSSR